MTRWHFLIIIILLSVLAAILWQAPPELLLDLTEQQKRETQDFPDSYLRNTKTTQYDAQGKVSHILTADKVSYFEGGKNHVGTYSLLESPRFTFFNNEEESPLPWRATSLTAEGFNGDQEVLLKGDVLMIKNIDEQTTPTTIRTEELLLRPNEQYAETDKPVIINDKSGTSSSVGLKLSMDEETIELLSNVRSRYEAP